MSRTALCSNTGALEASILDTVKLRNRSIAKPQNIVGPHVRKLRDQQGMTQEMLAARCGVLGWDLTRATLSKIEAQLRCVTDKEMKVLAEALRVGVEELYPAMTDGERKAGRTSRWGESAVALFGRLLTHALPGVSSGSLPSNPNSEKRLRCAA